MLNSFRYFVRGLGVFGFATVFSFSALAQSAGSQSPISSRISLPLSTKQQASLGIQVGAVQVATGGQLLVSATVVVPPGNEFTVSAPYAGQLSRLLVGIGDRVKTGNPLALFTSPMLGDARRLLNEASLDYKNATAAAQRDQVMFDEGIIPAVRLQLSRSKQEAALAQLRAREAELLVTGVQFDTQTGYATGTIKAPMSGTVSEAFAAVGQRVEAGAILFKLVDSSKLQLDLQLSSDKAAQLQVGNEITIASRNANAKIIGVSRAVDASQSARARATVMNRGTLQAGELVSVVVHTKTNNGTIKPELQWLVPSRALTQWRGKSWLFVATDKGFEAVAVNVISSTDELSLVESNLTVGSKVAITGIASLRALLQKDE
jgi:cobalt-zinc-cadmium efflux system membrane fusion protein